MSKSAIEWTDDTWNPVSGCTRVSAGCDHCYAVKMTKRLEAMGKTKYAGLVNIGKGHFNGTVKTHEDALTIPLKAKKPRRWFVNSMSDLFHKEVPFEFIDKVFAVMALCPQHTFQILTKRPERMAEYFASRPYETFANGNTLPDDIERAIEQSGFATEALCDHFDAIDYQWMWPLPNVWLGTSVEDQQTADERIPHLLRCPAAVRFLSCEPLLGPVEFVEESWTCKRCGHWLGYGLEDVLSPCMSCGCSSYVWGMPSDKATLFAQCVDDGGIGWVIVGGESGPGARPMHPNWARSLRDQCVAAGVPFFFKQWGEWGPGDFTTYERVGKKKSGRLLDGRTWDEFPEVVR